MTRPRAAVGAIVLSTVALLTSGCGAPVSDAAGKAITALGGDHSTAAPSADPSAGFANVQAQDLTGPYIREADGAAFLREASKDGLLKYAKNSDEATTLGVTVCRSNDQDADTAALTTAGFDESDAADFVGLALSVLCPHR